MPASVNSCDFPQGNTTTPIAKHARMATPSAELDCIFLTALLGAFPKTDHGLGTTFPFGGKNVTGLALSPVQGQILP